MDAVLWRLGLELGPSEIAVGRRKHVMVFLRMCAVLLGSCNNSSGCGSLM
jgi:hypothetical protein